MSNPDGYQCHGLMVAVEMPGVSDGASAFLCLTCGVYRHRFSPGDSRRVRVDAAMPAIIDAHLVGPELGEMSHE